MKVQKIMLGLAAGAAFAVASGSASAASYVLVAWHQRSDSGALSSLEFRAGAAQGCPGANYQQPCHNPTQAWNVTNGVIAAVTGSPATWDWNGTTMTLSGLLWAASHISSAPAGPTVISDKITGLTITPGTLTTTATTYECVEGTFLDGVNANGCLNIDQGTDGITQSSAVYNVGGNANCVDRTVAGDDVSTGDPRGVVTAAAGGGCDAVEGGFGLWNVIANPRFLILSETAVITNDGCYMFGRASDAASSPCATDAGVAGASYMIFAPNVDTDGDGVIDALDNCKSTSNLPYNNSGILKQVDSNGDGLGNRCDGDLNNNGVTNAQDYVLFRAQLGQPSTAPTFNQADFNNNGVVNSQDYVLFRGLLGVPIVGLSGLCVDSTNTPVWPCPANP